MTWRKVHRLAALRESKGVTQRQVAIELGTTERTVNRWETGATGASEENIARLAEFFGVSRAYLLGCDDGNGNGIEAAA